MKKQVCDGCGNCVANAHITHIEVGGVGKMARLCEDCYAKSGNNMYFEKKSRVRCVKCKKKMRKRIYPNGNISYVCEKCRG